MKKILYYLVFFVVAITPFTLASCGDDDDDQPEANESNLIVGTWLRGEYETLYFSSNGKFKISGANSYSGTYKYDKPSQQLYFYLEEENGHEDDDIWSYTVLTLTKDKLVIYSNAGGVTETYKRKQ